MWQGSMAPDSAKRFKAFRRALRASPNILSRTGVFFTDAAFQNHQDQQQDWVMILMILFRKLLHFRRTCSTSAPTSCIHCSHYSIKSSPLCVCSPLHIQLGWQNFASKSTWHCCRNLPTGEERPPVTCYEAVFQTQRVTFLRPSEVSNSMMIK